MNKVKKCIIPVKAVGSTLSQLHHRFAVKEAKKGHPSPALFSTIILSPYKCRVSQGNLVSRNVIETELSKVNISNLTQRTSVDSLIALHHGTLGGHVSFNTTDPPPISQEIYIIESRDVSCFFLTNGSVSYILGLFPTLKKCVRPRPFTRFYFRSTPE